MSNRPFTVAVELDLIAPDAMAASVLARSMLREIHIVNREKFAPAERGEAFRVRGAAARWMPPFRVVLMLGTEHDDEPPYSTQYDTMSAAWRALDGMLHNAIRQEVWPKGARLEIRDKLGGVIATRDERWFNNFREEKLGRAPKPK